MQIRAIIAVIVTAVAVSSASAYAGSESRGAYLARIGDCTSCHTSPDRPLFSGGFQVHAPFGTIYGTNITPDREFGIGTYSLEEFSRAVRKGVAKDGSHLYPAMPYPSFAGISDGDMAALYDYFENEVPAIHSQAPLTNLPFPFNQRWGIWFWNLLFAGDAFRDHPEQDATWNRGAYLVQTLGHCGACHTPRGIFYQEKSRSDSALFVSGETLDNWRAPDLRGDPASGLGAWSEEDVAKFLKTGHASGVAAFGTMAQVIENSAQFMNEADTTAIAHYLKSLAPFGEQASYSPKFSSAQNELPGAGLYASACASCHDASGAGKVPRIPKLAGNSAILSPDAASVVRIVLEGGKSAETQNGGKSQKMPAFGERLNDEEVAAIATFIRRSWGNRASAVTPRQVLNLRRALKP